MNKNSIKSLILVWALACSAVSNSIGGEYRLQLPGDYQLIKSNRWQHNICDKRGVEVIPPDIREYKVINNFVLGLATIPTNPQFKVGSLQGYFVLDTASKTIKFGMNYADFEEFCNSVGVNVPKTFDVVE